MKLTNTIRDAFVRAAMLDVPHVDFVEQRRNLVQEEARDKMPPKVRAVYDDKATRDFLATRYVDGSYVVAAHAYAPSAALAKKLAELKAKGDAQAESRKDLKNKLSAVAQSASTRKALADMLPEFAKYLPADEPAALRTLPVISNVVADFTKAGWPKGKKAEAKTKQAA